MNNAPPEHTVQEYDDGPWATGGSDSCSHNVDARWYFPGPEVTGTDEVNEPNIFIERCGQGFLVYVGQDKLAFTDGLDAARWLLGWLGFEEEIVESVRDILAGLWDADELYGILANSVPGVDYDELVGRAVSWNDPEQRRPLEYERALDVAGAAWAYIELDDCGYDAQQAQYKKLVEAVRKWRTIEGG